MRHDGGALFPRRLFQPEGMVTARALRWQQTLKGQRSRKNYEARMGSILGDECESEQGYEVRMVEYREHPRS